MDKKKMSKIEKPLSEVETYSTETDNTGFLHFETICDIFGCEYVNLYYFNLINILFFKLLVLNNIKTNFEE